jgi:hypothetical protein
VVFAPALQVSRAKAVGHCLVLDDMLWARSTDTVVSIDVEMWEKDQKHTILEVGVAFTSGDVIRGSQNEGEINIVHYVVEEGLSYKNGVFCPDNRDNFRFGESQIASKAQVAVEVNGILNEARRTSDTVYLVGHSIGGDRKWLKEVLGVDTAGTVECDVAEAWMAQQGRYQKSKLEAMCERYQVSARGAFHNGGNDALYTLRLCRKMVEERRWTKEITF